MRRIHRLFTWPLGAMPIVVPWICIALVAAEETSSMWGWRYQVWSASSARFHEVLILVAPLAAAAATYYAGRIATAGRMFALASSFRMGGPVAARHIAVLSTSFVSAYLVGMAPLVVLTVQKAHGGAPDILAIGSGVLGLVAAIVLGYVAGVVTSTSWFAPATLLLVFLLVQLNASTDRLFAATVPVLHVELGAGIHENRLMNLYRLAFLALVIVVSGFAAARALARANRWKSPSLSTAGAVAIIVVMCSIGNEAAA